MGAVVAWVAVRLVVLVWVVRAAVWVEITQNGGLGRRLGMAGITHPDGGICAAALIRVPSPLVSMLCFSVKATSARLL